MRYLLMVLGFLCVPVGLEIVYGMGGPNREAHTTVGGALIVAGALLFAIGGATCDIVDAIKGSKQP